MVLETLSDPQHKLFYIYLCSGPLCETKYKLDLPIEGGDRDRGRHHQVLGVGVVRVHSGSSLGQSSEMLLCNIYLKAV